MLRLVLVHGAKPWIYYMTERYRPGAMRDAGALLMRNEMKHGLWKALNRVDAEARKYRRNLGDKLEAAEWCAENGLPYPRTLMVVEREDAIWRGGPLTDLDRDLFVKRRDSRGAYGTAGYRRTAVFEYLDDHDRRISLAQIIVELVRRSRRESLLVQPLLHTHPAIADLAEDALITLRLVTCLDEQLRPALTIAYFRSVAKLEPRWNIGRLEEFASTIDLETGALGRMTGDKAESLSEWTDHHPVTGAPVTGRIVPFWPEVVQLVIKAHGLLPGRVVVGWDVAVTEDGPVLLEGNSFPDNIYPQRLYQKPIGHLRFGELLNFHFDCIEAQLDQSRNS
ncbi:MAG: sugar-transfer associated ATP-grasp domain-containing protein [Dongiaceae bacterium]